MSIRPVKRFIKSKPTVEGAGVHLRRAFGFGNTNDFDLSFCSMISATMFQRTIWQGSRGIHIGELRRLHMSSLERLNMATAWAIVASYLRVMSSG
jgi:hypothetical protein